jgi:hypothetical protein
MVRSKNENTRLAEKTNTTRGGFRETATTRNVELEKQPQREIFALGKLQWR